MLLFVLAAVLARSRCRVTYRTADIARRQGGAGPLRADLSRYGA